MKIGSAWRCQSEDKLKDWIGIKLDDSIYTLYPQLKELSFKLWAVPVEERTKENSPQFTLTANPKMSPEVKND